MRFRRPVAGLLWLLLFSLPAYILAAVAMRKPFISEYLSLLYLVVFVLVAWAAGRGILPGTGPGPLAAERTAALGFKDTFVLLIYYLLIQVAITIFASALCEAAGRPELAWLPRATCLESIAASLGYAFFTIWISRAKPRELLRFAKTSRLVPPILLLAIAGAEILCSEADNLLRALFTYPDFLVKVLQEVLDQGIYSLIAVAVAAPLAEEIVFRGVILGSFLKKYSPRRAIVLSAASFAIVHLNPVQIPGAFGLGILLAWIYYRSGNLWLSIAIHAAHNLFVFLVGTYQLPFRIAGFNASGKFQPLWFDLSGVLLLAAALFMFASLYRPRRVSDEPQGAVPQDGSPWISS